MGGSAISLLHDHADNRTVGMPDGQANKDEFQRQRQTDRQTDKQTWNILELILPIGQI